MKKIHNNKTPVTLDLFCGAGGMSMGFQMAGYNIALGMDINPDAVATYNHNFDHRCVLEDIRKIKDPVSFIHQYDMYHIDVIIGGSSIRSQRDPESGLLLLYMLSNKPAEIDLDIPVVAFGISFPTGCSRFRTTKLLKHLDIIFCNCLHIGAVRKISNKK